MKAMLGMASEEPPHEVDNASITRLMVNGAGRLELVEFNNVEHLADIGSASDGY
jgi:hypothetical protein